MEYLSLELFHNTLKEWLWALGVFAVALIGLKIFKQVLLAKLKSLSKKTKNEWDDILIEGVNAIKWPFYVLLSVYIGLQFVYVLPVIDKWAYYIILIVVVYYIIKVLEGFIDYGTKVIIEKRNEDEGSAGIIKFIRSLIKIVVWVGAVVLLLSNMGYNVTSLVAGLGIGGIAIALAVQNLLGDLFSSLSIYLDKPFQVGDFIAVGDNFGTVKRVGIKTTRIELLQGEELVVSNSQLTSSEIRNFGQMYYRRVMFNIGIVYNTPIEKLRKVPDIIKNIIIQNKKTEVERVHFKSFGDFSLGFEVVYYVNSADYLEYMDIQEAINLSIAEKFQEEGISMAFPTQTIHLNKIS